MHACSSQQQANVQTMADGCCDSVRAFCISFSATRRYRSDRGRVSLAKTDKGRQKARRDQLGSGAQLRPRKKAILALKTMRASASVSMPITIP